jgi:hypothetical protein
MRRLDKKSAIEASPVKIALTILDALVDASESQEAQIAITVKNDLRHEGVLCSRTCTRLEYGSSSTFIETLESGRGYAEDVSNLVGVFRFLSKALVQRDEEAESEARTARFDERIGAIKRAADNYESATARDAEFLAKKDIEDSEDGE